MDRLSAVAMMLMGLFLAAVFHDSGPAEIVIASNAGASVYNE
jgi:hypothetical protein